MVVKRSANLISKQYDKKSLLGETWSRLRTNPGAVFGLILLLSLILMMLYGVLFVPMSDALAMNAGSRYATPGAAHLLGADDMGRDMFIRVIYGARYSIAVGFGAVALAFVIGTFLGATAGYYGGMYEEIIMRVTDILFSIPALLLGMVIVSILGNTLTNLMLAVGIATIPQFARMTRASVLSVKGQEFIEAAHAIGMSNLKIIFTQVIPNCLSPLIVLVTSRIGMAILDASSLSFLGFGIQPPKPEWGAMVSIGRNFIRTAPHLAFFPGLFIMLTTFSCTLLGDGLRDALDPKLKQ